MIILTRPDHGIIRLLAISAEQPAEWILWDFICFIHGNNSMWVDRFLLILAANKFLDHDLYSASKQSDNLVQKFITMDSLFN